MPARTVHISFWAALAFALAGAAALSERAMLVRLVSAGVWAEVLRPLLIAAILFCLALAAALAYGGATDALSSEDASVAAPVPPLSLWLRLERPALWMAALLSLAAVLAQTRG